MPSASKSLAVDATNGPWQGPGTCASQQRNGTSSVESRRRLMTPIGHVYNKSYTLVLDAVSWWAMKHWRMLGAPNAGRLGQRCTTSMLAGAAAALGGMGAETFLGQSFCLETWSDISGRLRRRFQPRPAIYRRGGELCWLVRPSCCG